MSRKLTFVFVHGLSGWGSYDKAYRRMPYWGKIEKIGTNKIPQQKSEEGA